MASSTTRPMESASASRVSELMEKPKASADARTSPTNHTGIATSGMKRGAEQSKQEHDHEHDQQDRLANVW